MAKIKLIWGGFDFVSKFVQIQNSEDYYDIVAISASVWLAR